jgi:hypothetical protein
LANTLLLNGTDIKMLPMLIIFEFRNIFLSKGSELGGKAQHRC